MQIGDYVRAIPTELSCDVDHRTKEPIPMIGRVIYIHPEQRILRFGVFLLRHIWGDKGSGSL